MKYISIFQSKALLNLPKLVFFVWKQTIWQPWWRRAAWVEIASPAALESLECQCSRRETLSLCCSRCVSHLFLLGSQKNLKKCKLGARTGQHATWKNNEMGRIGEIRKIFIWKKRSWWMLALRRPASVCAAGQGCQIVYFQTENPHWVYLGGPWNRQCWYIVWSFGIVYNYLVCFAAILWPFGQLFPILVFLPGKIWQPCRRIEAYYGR
jgi:hypothetical protein